MDFHAYVHTHVHINTEIVWKDAWGTFLWKRDQGGNGVSVYTCTHSGRLL